MPITQNAEHESSGFCTLHSALCTLIAEEGLVAKQTEAAQRPQVHPRHADYDGASDTCSFVSVRFKRLHTSDFPDVSLHTDTYQNAPF